MIAQTFCLKVIFPTQIILQNNVSTIIKIFIIIISPLRPVQGMLGKMS